MEEMMRQYKLIEIFTSEDAQWNHQPLHKAVVAHINRLKIAARTLVTRGIEGSYENGDTATDRIEVLALNMPLRITIILPASELEAVLAGIQDMVTDGIIALRDLDVVSHKTNGCLLPKSTRIREIMTPAPVSVRRNTPLREVVKILLSSTFTGLAVVDGNNRPVGVIAQGDLIYKGHLSLRLGLLPGLDHPKTDEIFAALEGRKAEDIMTSPAVVVEEDQPVTTAVNLMIEKNVKRLPVVDAAGRLVGNLSRLDVFQTVVKECPDWKNFQGQNIRVENLKSVSDIVRSDACTVLPETSVDEVIRIIDCNDIERVCVVDRQGYFCGLISDRDLLIAFADRHPGIWDYLMSKFSFTERGRRQQELKDLLQARTAAEVMKKDVVTIQDDAPLEEAIQVMLERVIKRLPVIDKDGKFKGIISRDSLLRAGFGALQDHS
jgi:CBS domain-containing protein